MKVQKIFLENFGVHTHTEILFPHTGLVLITGANGSGKSTIIEAVSVCCWGKSLRGETFWDDQQGSVVVTTNAIAISRVGTALKKSLQFDSIVGGMFPVFDTQTKAQDTLNSVIGSLDLWRRTHVLSSADAQAFSLASSSERMRLLETVLALDRFDNAHARALEILKNHKQEIFNVQNKISVLEHSIQSARARLARAEADVHAMVDNIDVGQYSERVEVLKQNLVPIREMFELCTNALVEEQTAIAVESTEINKAKIALSKILNCSVCPTCSQPITDTVKQALKQNCAVTIAQHEDTLSAAKCASELTKLEISAYREQLSKFNDEISTLKNVLNEHETIKNTLNYAQKIKEQVQHELQNLLSELAQLKQTSEVLSDQLSHHQLTSETLAPTGARVLIVSNTIKQLQDRANAWLKVFGDLTVEVVPYTERTSGKIVPQINMNVVVNGKKLSYAHTSSGERRRVDLAMMLALRDIAIAQRSAEQGTVFFDEAFDALDTSGIDAVSKALLNMTQNQCCVVITHNERLVEQLRTQAALVYKL